MACIAMCTGAEQLLRVDVYCLQEVAEVAGCSKDITKPKARTDDLYM